MFKKHIMQPAHMDPNKIQMHKNVTTSLHTHTRLHCWTNKNRPKKSIKRNISWFLPGSVSQWNFRRKLKTLKKKNITDQATTSIYLTEKQELTKHNM